MWKPLMTSSLLVVVLVLVALVLSSRPSDAAMVVVSPNLMQVPKVNLFSELQKLTRWSQNFVAEQIVKGAQVLPGGKNVDLRPLLDLYRPKMRSGWPGLSIPVLEPLDLPYVSLDNEDEDVTLQGYLKDSHLRGISSVCARNLTLNLASHCLNFGLVFPQLTMVGHYKVNGTLSSSLAIAGEGPYSITAWDVTLAGSLKLKVAQRSVQVEHVNVRLSLSKLKMDLENFLGGGDVGRVMCETFSKAAPAILEQERDKVSRELSRHVEETLNRKLEAAEWSPDLNQCLLSVFKLPCIRRF